MLRNEKMLSESVADEIQNMITVDKRFAPGDKLPNENVLAEELKISRTTLREAIKILTTHEILVIRRGKGTYVADKFSVSDKLGMNQLSGDKIDARDLYEMRLIFEPEAAYYAALRATDRELMHMIELADRVEEKIRRNEDRTDAEKEFHRSIAKATHNEFMNRLMPILYQAIGKGVALSKNKSRAVDDTLQDHRMIKEFLKERDGEGARVAMKLHIIHAIKELDIS